MRATENDDPQKERKLTTYSQVGSSLIATYATEDVIAKEEAEITNFKKPEHMSAVRYLEVLFENALLCGRVYEEARLKRYFIEQLHGLVRLSMRTYSGGVHIRARRCKVKRHMGRA